MARHRKYELLNQLEKAINESGYNVLYTGSIHEHPFVMKIYNESESYSVRIYIWNLTHGGGRLRAANEYRIQITGVNQFQQIIGEKTLILGWWEQVGVFAGFDYTRHTGILGASPSIQIREENLRRAILNGFSPCDKENGETAIAFRPDFFVDYLKNLESIHNIINSPEEVQIVENIIDGNLTVNSQELTSLPQERQAIIILVTKKIREISFSRRVLNAYGNRCAFSGMQLKLVDAAHILPVSAPNSTDETCNGIALSALYHRAYDRGLITFDENYGILINERKIRDLRQLGIDGGEQDLRRMLRPMIIVPPDIRDRPNTNFITTSNELRGWI